MASREGAVGRRQEGRKHWQFRWPSSGTSGGEASAHSRGIVPEEEMETETQDEWVDVHIHAHERSVPWVDIDLEPIVDEIANHQCAIAESYFEQKRLQICRRLLRLVIRKCQFDSIVRALRCMASCCEETFGAPEEKQQRQGRRLRRCAEEISHGHDPEWFQEKENMLLIRQATLPELAVLEVVTQRHSALSSVPSKPHSDGVFVADESNRMEYDRDRQESQKLALLPKTAPGMQPSKITDPPPPFGALEKFRNKTNADTLKHLHLGSQEQDRNLFSVLNNMFFAYSVFLPRPKESLDLFQVVFLHSDRGERHHSPRESTFNLKTFFNSPVAPRSPEGLQHDSINLIRRAIMRRAFLDEFEKIRGLGDYQYAQEPLPIFVSVSESSLVRAGASITIPPVDGIPALRDTRASRTLKVSQTSVSRYTGNKLKRLIWTYIKVIFPIIYVEIEDELPQEDDGRALMAIVTRKIIANIDVSSSSMKSTKAGLSYGAPAAPVSVGGERSRTFESCISYSGVTGLHMILLPVERRGEYEYRVFKPIDVCNSEREEDGDDSESSGFRSRFTDAKKWHQGKEPLERDKMDVNIGNSDGTSTEKSGGEASSHSRGNVPEEEMETETQDECVDVHIHANERSLPWVDIDLEPIVDEMANGADSV